MGGGTFDSHAYANYSNTIRSASVDEIYKSKTASAVLSGAAKHLNPHGVAVRESRDSVEHPNSTAIIVAIDVTGSMGMLAEKIAKHGLGTLFNEILARQPVTDPQLMFMAIGDANYDSVPLQVSQFESSNVIVDQLTDIFVEGGGGGNQSESYQFPWYFGALHTSIDCLEKRGKKGYLFTLGDESVPPALTREQIKKFIGDDAERDYTPAELLTMVQRMYHVFHIVVEEGSYGNKFLPAWKTILGERALLLSDHTKLAELIVSVLQVNEGADANTVADSWDGSTAVVVRKAIGAMVAGAEGSAGVVRV
jgi:hypothetical protein